MTLLLCVATGNCHVLPAVLIGSLRLWISQSLTSSSTGTGACRTPPRPVSAALLNGQLCYPTVRPAREDFLHRRLVLKITWPVKFDHLYLCDIPWARHDSCIWPAAQFLEENLCQRGMHCSSRLQWSQHNNEIAYQWKLLICRPSPSQHHFDSET